ncbi:unnamed protein product [Parnassius apollo]|uniref:(apollo) hypothetical protein n=1 Tax=Parnassius apollo TaxID=110799 RepID=A0A8S3YC79_PARAO|nr:unnamed protein product [Parnassius apollo]
MAHILRWLEEVSTDEEDIIESDTKAELCNEDCVFESPHNTDTEQEGSDREPSLERSEPVVSEPCTSQARPELKLSTPGEKKETELKKIELDNFDLCALRNLVNSFYTVRKESPTLKKILTAAKADLNFPAYERCFTPSNIRAGFAKTGIYPLNRTAVCPEAIAPSRLTDQPLPTEPIQKILIEEDLEDTIPNSKIETTNSDPLND